MYIYIYLYIYIYIYIWAVVTEIFSIPPNSKSLSHKRSYSKDELYFEFRCKSKYKNAPEVGIKSKTKIQQT